MSVMSDQPAGSETAEQVLWDGAWLKELRLRCGYESARALADKAGVSASFVTGVESNEVRNPGLVYMLKCVRAMGVPLSALFDETPDGNEYHQGYTAALLDMQDALHHLRRAHEG